MTIVSEQQQTASLSENTGRLSFSLRMSLLRDSTSYFVSRIIPGLTGVISVPILIRLIGIEEYGRLAVILPFLLAIGGAGSGWLTQGILRFHPSPSETDARAARFKSAIVLGTVLSLLTMAIVLIPVVLRLQYSAATALLVEGFCFAFLVYSVVLGRLQAQLQPLGVMKREGLRSVGGLAIAVVLVLVTGRKDFQLVLLGLGIAYALALVLTLRIGPPVRKAIEHFNEDARSKSDSAKAILRHLWHYGWAVGLWLLISQMLPVIDRWTIQKFVGYTQAGVYASLYEVAVRSFSFFAIPLAQAAHPRIMRSWNDGEYSVARDIINSTMKYQVLIFAPIFVVVVVFARRITSLVLGLDNATAASVLPVLVLGGFLWQLALLVHKPLEIRQQTKAMLWGMAVVVFLSLVANLLLVPRFGYAAAAYVLVFSSSSYLIYVFFAARLFGGMRPSIIVNDSGQQRLDDDRKV